MATADGTKAILDVVLTRWCNVHLPQDCQLKDLSCLKDVSRSAVLLEELSGNKWTRRNPAKHRLLSKILRNTEWDALLGFIEKEEQVELEQPVHSKDIAKGDLKSIRVLVWSLALHYHIKPTISSFPPSCPALKEPSISKKLFSFVLEKLPSHLKPHLQNLTSSWSDGTLLMGLLESLSPREGKGKERKAQGQGGKEGGESNINATVALEYAESAFGVPKLLTHAELSSGSIDEKCTIIYLYDVLSRADLSDEKSKELEKAVFVMIYGKDGEDCTCKAEDVAKELKCEIGQVSVIVTVVRSSDTFFIKKDQTGAVWINALYTDGDPSILKALKTTLPKLIPNAVITTSFFSTKEIIYPQQY